VYVDDDRPDPTVGIRKKKLQENWGAKPIYPVYIVLKPNGADKRNEEKVCIRKPSYIHSTESQAKDIIVQKDVETTSDITRLLGRRACIICSVGRELIKRKRERGQLVRVSDS
jgi:hypothetical protein